MFKLRYAEAVEDGAISAEDAEACNSFLDMTGYPSISIYVMAKTGKLTHLENNEGFQATMRVMETLGLGAIEFDLTSAQPAEEQFWGQFDGVYELTET